MMRLGECFGLLHVWAMSFLDTIWLISNIRSYGHPSDLCSLNGLKGSIIGLKPMFAMNNSEKTVNKIPYLTV